jgi:uncharacterized protein (TIGR02145 family)
MKKHLLLVVVFSLWGMVGSLYAQVNKTVWVDEPFTVSSEGDTAPGTGTYRWTRDGSVIPSSNTKELTTSESTEGIYRYVRQKQTAGCPDWVSSNTCVVLVVKPNLPPDTGTQTWSFSGLTWTMSGQTWTDPNWKQTWSGASSYIPAGCALSTDFAENAPPRYRTAGLYAGSGYLYNYVCVYKEQHNLCPAPWRVPTTQDYIDLDRKFGGSGENRTTASLAEFITPYYINQWGGVLAGYVYSTLLTQAGTRMLYWSNDGDGVRAVGIALQAGSCMWTAHSSLNAFQLRCVR